LGKIENGIVAVTAVIESITVPLLEVYKPRTTQTSGYPAASQKLQQE